MTKRDSLKRSIVKYLRSCGIVRTELKGKGILRFKKNSDWCELVADDIADRVERLYKFRRKYNTYKDKG